jgi:anti-sigma factor RsiW
MTRPTGAAPTELTCREFVELVTPWLDDALSAIDRRSVEAHLADCDDCTIHVEQVRTSIGLLRRLRDDPLDPRIQAALIAALPRSP